MPNAPRLNRGRAIARAVTDHSLDALELRGDDVQVGEWIVGAFTETSVQACVRMRKATPDIAILDGFVPGDLEIADVAAMITKAEANAAREGASIIQITLELAYTTAMYLFDTIGYSPTGRSFVRDGCTMQVFTKMLPARDESNE